MTKRNELASKLSNSGQDTDSISKLISDLNQQMLDINTEIEQLTNESKQTSSLLIKLQDKHQKNRILFSNYNSLKTDYQKEIDRLSFIVQHEMMHKNIKKILNVHIAIMTLSLKTMNPTSKHQELNLEE